MLAYRKRPESPTLKLTRSWVNPHTTSPAAGSPVAPAQASGFLLSSPQRTQRSQVFDRKLDQVSIVVEPLVARQAPDKLLAAIVGFDKRLFALDAVLDHRLVSRPAARASRMR